MRVEPIWLLEAAAAISGAAGGTQEDTRPERVIATRVN
jgi:hypothetical protein